LLRTFSLSSLSFPPKPRLVKLRGASGRSSGSSTLVPVSVWDAKNEKIKNFEKKGTMKPVQDDDEYYSDEDDVYVDENYYEEDYEDEDYD
jgi:hypothetical protein